MKRKPQIIIDLIRIDLINHKLINSLQALAIEAEIFTLGIDSPIFELMELQDRNDADDIFAQYYDYDKSEE